MSRLLNFGCGNVFHPGWLNLDAAPSAPAVIAHDLRRGLPYADESFDAVYSSHVLEHFEPSAAAQLLRECLRILRPDGIARLVVPDLEAIARLYLQSLERALAGEGEEAKQRYDWAMLELYDQAVRTAPGGAMGAYLRSAMSEQQAKDIARRIGYEAIAPPPAGASVRRRLVNVLSAVRRLAAGAGVSIFLGTEGREALREGLFRRSGEVHRWMYDRYSMQIALESAGFSTIRVCAADESEIPGFAAYGLETRDGRPRKPDSIYVEARKPRSR